MTTLKFIVFGVVPTVFIALGLAMLINMRFRLVGVVRSLYLIPAAMSYAASAVVWRYIFQDGPGFGILDYAISRFGVTPPDWLASPTWALPALDIITVWLSLPAATILYLAALQRIPDVLIEAAALDGAGPVRRVRYIIWPGVRYMTVLVAIVALLSFTNGSFDLVNILTKGDPIYATQTLIYYIFVTGFSYGFFGYAAALSVLQVALIGGILLTLRTVSRLVTAMIRSRRTTRRIRILVAVVVGLVLSSPMLYMVSASLMSNAQLSVQPPELVPDLVALLRLLRGLLGDDAGHPVAELRQLGRLHRRGGRAAVAPVHQRRLRDREDALPRARPDHGDVRRSRCSSRSSRR